MSHGWGENQGWSLHWRYNERGGVSNHQPHDCLLNRLFSHRSKKTWKLLVTGLCEGNSPVTGEFPAQRASNAEKVSIWLRHHDMTMDMLCMFQHIVANICFHKNYLDIDKWFITFLLMLQMLVPNLIIEIWYNSLLLIDVKLESHMYTPGSSLTLTNTAFFEAMDFMLIHIHEEVYIGNHIVI